MAEPARPLEGLVREALSKLTKDERLTKEGMQKVWGRAAGKKAAGHSAPASLRRSTLVVNVDGSSWLYELTLKRRDILRKLKSEFAGKKIKELRFRIGEV